MRKGSVVINKDVLIQESGSDYCVYNKKTEKIIHVNRVGFEILKRISNLISIEVLLEVLSHENNVSKEEIENDVLAYLDDLLKNKIIFLYE
ncbi:MAG: PqqD family protein [Bdellovibrionota bacterium]|nr:PqqD family protein [Pseudomonadota bacterium]MDY6090629.1 PqqD family protein [Bdellovibrionota bacterium]